MDPLGQVFVVSSQKLLSKLTRNSGKHCQVLEVIPWIKGLGPQVPGGKSLRDLGFG